MHLQEVLSIYIQRNRMIWNLDKTSLTYRRYIFWYIYMTYLLFLSGIIAHIVHFCTGPVIILPFFSYPFLFRARNFFRSVSVRLILLLESESLQRLVFRFVVTFLCRFLGFVCAWLAPFLLKGYNENSLFLINTDPMRMFYMYLFIQILIIIKK